MPAARPGGAIPKHAAPLVLFAAITIAWTWPLVRHVGDALPGDPGDNYSFVWNLWWMRHVLATRLPYFHTSYLFYPFGTTIADHPHTALPALVAATLLAKMSPATAQNILILVYVFANLAAMYALAWSITRHVRGSMVAAIVFGLSPYVAVHLLGHFDLVAAFTIPLFALFVRWATLDRATARPPNWHALAAGATLAATAYIAYYHVVYLVFFTIVYLVAWVDPFAVSRAHKPPTRRQTRLRAACAIAAVVFVVLAIVIVASGGWTVAVGAWSMSVRAPQNALTAAWIFTIAAALLTFRPVVRANRVAASVWRPAASTAIQIAVAFVVGAAPLLWQAAQLLLRGEYVTPEYGWRSIPRGIDLVAPIAGHPLHPVFGGLSRRAYAAIGQDFVETIGWFGVVPVLLLVGSCLTSNNAKTTPDPVSGDRTRVTLARELGVWRVVAVVFVVWALGPFLVVGGFDTGLKLPAILLRYVPFVANARMPGRAVVVVYMALAVIVSVYLSTTRGLLRSAAAQGTVFVLIAFEFWAAPLQVTMLDRPAVYDTLKAAPEGAVCEVPFGIGDGLSAGVGSQQRRTLFYATIHEHELVGGYIGRMPADAAEQYRRLPIVGTLLALSDGAPLPPAPDLDTAGSPCRYLVVDRHALSTPLAAYLQLLAPQRLASDAQRDLLRIR